MLPSEPPSILWRERKWKFLSVKGWLSSLALLVSKGSGVVRSSIFPAPYASVNQIMCSDNRPGGVSNDQAQYCTICQLGGPDRAKHSTHARSLQDRGHSQVLGSILTISSRSVQVRPRHSVRLRQGGCQQVQKFFSFAYPGNACIGVVISPHRYCSGLHIRYLRTPLGKA